MARGRGGRAAATAIAALGLVAATSIVAVGVGLTPHLPGEGLTPTSVLGLLCLAGGLALLVALGAATWRRGRWPSRVLLVTATVALLGVAVLTVGQAVAATVVARHPVGADPSRVGLAHADVRARTADGVDLSGWYVPSTNGAAVVLLHGSGSTRSDVLAQAKVLNRRGYGVLLLDARGHGSSAGRAMDFGWYGDLDVRAAVDVLSAQAGVDPGRIAAVGISMGGEEAIGAMAADDRIRAVVAEGATHRIAADRAWLSDEYGLRGRLQRALDELTYGIADLMTPANPPTALREAVAAAAPRRLLLITADERPDEGDAAAFIAAVSPGTVEVWVAPGGHGGALAAAPAEWAERVGAFLESALAGAPGADS